MCLWADVDEPGELERSRTGGTASVVSEKNGGEDEEGIFFFLPHACAADGAEIVMEACGFRGV